MRPLSLHAERERPAGIRVASAINRRGGEFTPGEGTR